MGFPLSENQWPAMPFETALHADKGENTMKKLQFREIRVVFVSLLLIVMPAIVLAQSPAPPAPPSAPPTAQVKKGPPPVAPQMVREGDFAVKLVTALGLGTTADEAEAESMLGEAGIVPRNGWIADYPVTPDIFAELHNSTEAAAETGKIQMGKDEALNKLENISAELSLAVKPYTGTKTYAALPEEAAQYPNPTVVNDYYTTEGPPVVTYYAPPPDYYYLYAWVPSPFWWTDFWFPGFFILNDFHRPFFFGHRWCFISNHFNDFRSHRVFRIDPVGRFHGRTFAGIGVSGRKGFLSTGTARSERRVFNGPRTRGGPERRATSQPSRGTRPAGVTNRGGRPAGPSGGVRSGGGGGRMSAPGGGGHGGGSPGGGGGHGGGR